MKAATNTTWLTILSFTVPAAALPFYYGYIGRAVHAPIIITSVLVGCWLWSGGRIGRGGAGMLPSVIYGGLLAAPIVFPFYYLGRWLGL